MVREWQRLDLGQLPEDSGVYGFRLGDQWLYIGKAKNIRKRLLDPRHRAFQIASEMEGVELVYQSWPQSHISRVESRYLKQLEPLWNGGTAHGYVTMPNATGCPTMQNKVAPLGPVCEQAVEEDRVRARAKIGEALRRRWS